jgi:hypothetical protein
MSNLVKTITVGDWTVVDDGDEPRVSAFEIARRAGMARERDVKKLIDRNRAELEAFGPVHMRATVSRISKPNGGTELREVETPMLNEWQSVALLAHMRTALGLQIRIEMNKLFVAVRRGETPAPALNGTVANSARIRDDPAALDKFRHAARCACSLRGYSRQLLYGFVRRTQKVSSPFDVSLHLLDHVLASLDHIARGHAHLGNLLPAAPEKQLALWSTAH